MTGAGTPDGGMPGAREEILARVRAALADGAAPPEVPRDYRRTGEHRPGAHELLDLLADRLVDYRATVHRSSVDDLAATLARALAATLPEGGALVVPAGLPAGWAVADAWADTVVDDGTLTPADLDRTHGVLTACRAACAETGTIVLDGSPDQGRRAITLVPDRHLVVVGADQVVQTVPELMGRLDSVRPLTFISGPSATSDIELERVEGVHGPRTLVVVLVG
jgi:L-lactate dehydrogenase complex protein LldG